jgi:hypothetical protein
MKSPARVFRIDLAFYSPGGGPMRIVQMVCLAIFLHRRRDHQANARCAHAHRGDAERNADEGLVVATRKGMSAPPELTDVRPLSVAIPAAPPWSW